MSKNGCFLDSTLTVVGVLQINEPNCLAHELILPHQEFQFYIQAFATVIVSRSSAVGHPNFFWKTGTNSTVDFGPNPDWTPIFSQFGICQTTCMRLRRSLVWLELALSGDLRSLIHVVKRLPNWLKISVQSGFGPKSTVEFVPVFQKKIGVA